MAKDSSKYKYNIATLAEDLGISMGSARQRLWKQGVEKNSDGMYGWTSFAVYKGIKALIKGGSGRQPAAASKARPAAKKVKAKKKPAKRKARPEADTD